MVKRTMALFGGTMRLGNRSGSSSGGGGTASTGGWVELTFRAKEEVPPLGAGLPPPPSLPPAVMPMAAPLPSGSVGSSSSGGGGGGTGAAAAVPATAASAAAAAGSGDGGGVAAAPPPRKTRKSIMGSGAAGGMEERLAAANNSNDAPRPAAAASGAASGGAAGLTGAGMDDALFLNKSGEEAVRVLIVDDDPVNLTILEDLLRSEGYDVLTAASGTEALETYLTTDPQPKLVLLDVTLPDMSGHEVGSDGVFVRV